MTNLNTCSKLTVDELKEMGSLPVALLVEGNIKEGLSATALRQFNRLLSNAKLAFPRRKFVNADTFVAQQGVEIAETITDTTVVKKIRRTVAKATPTEIDMSRGERQVQTFLGRATTKQALLARQLAKHDDKYLNSIVRQYEAGKVALSYQPLVDGLWVNLLYKKYELAAANFDRDGSKVKLDISLPVFDKIRKLKPDAKFLGVRPASLVVQGVLTKTGYNSASAHELVQWAIDGDTATKSSLAFMAYRAFRNEGTNYTPLGSKCYAEHTGEYSANGEVNASLLTVHAYLAALGFTVPFSSPYSRLVTIDQSVFPYAAIQRRIRSAARQNDFVCSQTVGIRARKTLVAESGKAKDYCLFPYPVIGYVISQTDMRVRDTVRATDFQVLGE